MITRIVLSCSPTLVTSNLTRSRIGLRKPSVRSLLAAIVCSPLLVASPVFPHSCSTATTNVSERLVNITQSAFAKLGDGHGLSEGGTGLGAGMAVLSGKDHRRQNARYVNRMMLSTNGGPASPMADGWVNYAIPVIAGLMYYAISFAERWFVPWRRE